MKFDFWNNFKELITIPRPSFYNEKILKYLSQYISTCGFKPIIDKTGNIFYTIPSNQYKKNESILLQAHADMVAVSKNNFDFKNNPITLVKKDDFLYANNTTLGADNGIGLSYILSITKNYKLFKHPTIEVLITWDEEVSPQGIKSFAFKNIKSRKMINLDNEELDHCSIGCAGVNETKICLDINYIKNNNDIFELSIKNAVGGHSGAYISDLRINAIKSLFEILSTFSFKYNIASIDISKYAVNVIPNNTSIHISFDKKYITECKNCIAKYLKKIKDIYSSEKDIEISINKVKENNSICLDEKCSYQITNIISAMPKPILLYNDLLNMFELSYNIAKVYIQDKKLNIHYSSRAIKYISHSLLIQQIKSILKLSNIKYNISDLGQTSVAWTPTNNNTILQAYEKQFVNMMKYKPKVEVCKGGLECGIIVANIPTMHAISFGPDIFEPHSINEHTSIKSCNKCFELLINILESL